jgi:spore coat polysaccharide biosynthesis protein SpsF
MKGRDGERTVAIIEARMASTRLPGKVLMPAGGQPMLAHLVRRLRAVPSLDDIVLATTTDPADDVLQRFADDAGIGCHRGSVEDVMQRVLDAATAAAAGVVVGITGDCPVIDPDIVEQAIRMFQAHDVDYASNCVVRSYPDGMDVQVYWLQALRRSAASTSERLDREHVTLHMRRHPESFRHVHLVAPPSLHWPELGLTLDEPADYALLSQLVESFPDRPLFGCGEAIAALRADPRLLALNRGVRRKGDT